MGQVERLIAEAQAQVERLGAKRAELIFVSRNLVDPYADNATRRQAEFFLNREPLYPEEKWISNEERYDATQCGYRGLAEVRCGDREGSQPRQFLFSIDTIPRPILARIARGTRPSSAAKP